MAKQQEIKESILVTPLEEIMSDRFGRYSKYIIQDRALPDARDGLKPVQRRILHSMNELGITANKPYKKSARIVGDVIGKYHPHGDSSVYDAMVRMSQSWKSRETLIDMHGNNGSMDDDPAAAMRYTEARLSPIAQYMLSDIEKNTVLFAPNFDDEETEPTVLPARYPNLLVNGITGIAAGYATNIPPHNLSEVLDATIYRLQFPDCSLEELMDFVQGPDFPTGGIVQGKQGIIDAFTTGKGKVIIRSKVEVVQTKTNQQIIVHEIPYEVIKSNLVKKIDDIRLNKQLEGILDVRDESDRNGLRIAIDLRKETNSDLVLNYLYKNTDLQVSYNYNVVAIVNKRPMQLGLAEMLDAFIAHRKDVVTRRCRFDLDKMEQRCHILEGLIKAISILDEIIALIRSSKGKADSKAKLIEKYSFTEAQAEAIVTLQLYRLSSTDVRQLKDEFQMLVNKMEELQDILNSASLLRKEIIRELKEVKKLFGSPRLTRIENEIEEIVIDKQAMIPNERVMITLSKDGYAKRVSLRSYNSSSAELTGLKEGDQLIGIKEVNMLDYLMFVTSQGTYGYVQVYELSEGKWKDIGSHLNSVISLGGEEKIVSAFILNSFETGATLITLTMQGMIKQTPIKDLEVSRRNKTMALMGLKDGDQLIACQVGYANTDVIVASETGHISRYQSDAITPTQPRGKGIIAMKAEKLVDLAVVDNSTSQIVFMTHLNTMKRMKLSDITATGRPVRGEMICKKVKSNPPKMTSMVVGSLSDEMWFLKENKKVILKDVALMNKDATFSSTIKLDNDNYLVRGIQDIKIVPIIETVQVSSEIEQESLF